MTTTTKLLFLPWILIAFMLLTVLYYIITGKNDNMRDLDGKYDIRVKAFAEIHDEINKDYQMPSEPITKKPGKYDVSHLTQETQIVWGPIQDDEALFLYGMIKAIRPKTLVEFGFSHGVSGTNFLKALDEDAKMYSYDIHEYNPKAEPYKDSRFKFILKSQTLFEPADIENRTIDLAYLDAGHSLSIEVALFPKLVKQMASNGIMVVHDTGLHINDNYGFCSCDFENLCGAQHQIGEREFINWIRVNYPEYDIINIHSFIQYRHGLTIIQRKYNLSVTPVEASRCKKP